MQNIDVVRRENADVGMKAVVVCVFFFRYRAPRDLYTFSLRGALAIAETTGTTSVSRTVFSFPVP